MSRRRALVALSDAFRGRLAADPDWMALFEAANTALVTPSLRRALSESDAAAAMPQDAAAFVAWIGARNDERNLRLRSMALDAVRSLNGIGVTPIYLKGMALWASLHPEDDHCPRMMSDVDLLVRPEEADRAIDALLASGFKLLARHPDDIHVVAEFWREGDVGVLDLHQRPPGPPGLAGLFDREAHTRPAAWPGAARVPSSAHQIYLTSLHDMLHSGGFWRGGFDVRHLCDIADLAGAAEGVDWAALKAVLRPRLVRNAVFSQLAAAHSIVGAPIPPDLRGFVPTLHYQRHRAQYLHPPLGFLLAVLGIGLEAFNLPRYWPHLGAEGMSFAQLVWWLSTRRAYPTKM